MEAGVTRSDDALDRCRAAVSAKTSALVTRTDGRSIATTGEVDTLTFTFGSGACASGGGGCVASYTAVLGDTLSTVATGLGNAIKANANLYTAPAGLTGTSQNPFATAMTILGSGLIGVNTGSVGTNRFVIEDGAGNNQFLMRYTGKTGFYGNQASSGNMNWTLGDNANLTMTTNNGSGAVLELFANGSISIGSTPQATGANNLYVQGTISAGTTSVTGTALNTSGTVYMASLGTVTAGTNGAVCISAANQLGANAANCIVSFRDAKRNIAPLEHGLDTVMALDPVYYRYRPEYLGADANNPDADGLQPGFIAEQVASVDKRYAILVHGKPRGVRYEQMTAAIVGAIKELKAENDNLKTEMAALKRRTRR